MVSRQHVVIKVVRFFVFHWGRMYFTSQMFPTDFFFRLPLSHPSHLAYWNHHHHSHNQTLNHFHHLLSSPLILLEVLSFLPHLSLLYWSLCLHKEWEEITKDMSTEVQVTFVINSTLGYTQTPTNSKYSVQIVNSSYSFSADKGTFSVLTKFPISFLPGKLQPLSSIHTHLLF